MTSLLEAAPLSVLGLATAVGAMLLLTAIADGSAAGWDREAALRVLAERDPVSCSVEVDRGKMTLVMSDGYRTGMMHYHFLSDRIAPPYAKMRDAGIHLHAARDLAVTPEGFDADGLEESILEVLAGDPQAYVMLGVSARWWGAYDASPATGFSIGDPVYRDGVARTLKSVGEYVRTHDVGKVVVGMHLDAAGDGQFYHTCVSEASQVDTSPANTAGFREWLQEKYSGDTAKLRTAWDDPAVEFDTADMAPSLSGGHEGWLREAVGAERRVMDTREFAHAMAPVRLIQAWSQAFKDGIKKPVVVSAWRPDASNGLLGNTFGGSALCSGPGRLESRVSVCEYGDRRRTNADGFNHATWSSYALRGVVSMRELDNRPPGVEEDFMPDGIGSPSAEEGLDGFRAQIRRDLGAAATRGQAAWYYEMGGTWYSRDDTWPALEEGARIMAWAHRPEAPSAIKEVAVFVDEEAGWRVGDVWPLYDAHFHSRPALNTSGIPFDLYFLDDIRNPDLPDYKAYILLLAATLNRAQLDAIKAKVHQAGKVLVVYATYATPGIGSPDFHTETALLQSELTTGPHRTHWVTTPLTPQFVHDIAMEAGIGTHGMTGQVTHVGAGVAVVHRLQEGPATVKFAMPVDLVELDGTTVRVRGVTEWEPECELRRADVIFYRYAP